MVPSVPQGFSHLAFTTNLHKAYCHSHFTEKEQVPMAFRTCPNSRSSIARNYLLTCSTSGQSTFCKCSVKITEIHIHSVERLVRPRYIVSYTNRGDLTLDVANMIPAPWRSHRKWKDRCYRHRCFSVTKAQRDAKWAGRATERGGWGWGATHEGAHSLPGATLSTFYV